MNKASFQINSFLKKLVRFFIIWLLVGFPISSGFLVGPVRWAVNFSKQFGWTQDAENLLVKILIVTCIASSFFIGLYLYKKIKTNKFIILIILNVIILLAWLNPRSLNTDEFADRLKTAKEGFYFGSYPDLHNLDQLKQDGITAVISLLHPAVLPMEPVLMEQEQKNAKKVGITLIQLPMLPWVGENDAALQKIAELVKNGHEKKYYVHCYLGKDRVNLVKMIVKTNHGTIINQDQKTQGRKLTDIAMFESGRIIPLDNNVYLIPFPTNEEYFGYILHGMKQIVSFVNSQDYYYVGSNQHSESYNEQLHPAYKRISFNMFPYDPYKLVTIIEQIKKLPQPLVIYVYRTDSAIAQALELTYKTGKPSLPPLLFTNLSHADKISAVSNNAIIGDIPEASDIDSLFVKGVRKIAYIGNSIGNKKIALLKKIAIKSSLTWIDIDLQKDDLSHIINDGSTWYIFGADTTKIIEFLSPETKKPVISSAGSISSQAN